MGQELSTIIEMTEPEYGPKMLALAPLQRNLVVVYLAHPTWSVTALATEAGYSQSSAATRGSINMRDPRVIDAINEEGQRVFNGTGPAVALMGFMKLALNEGHKDHFRALEAIANRTGHHATTEHKLVVDDKRPQTKAELIAFIKAEAADLQLSPAMIAELTGEKIVDAEFTDVSEVRERIEANGWDQDVVDAAIAAEMEDL